MHLHQDNITRYQDTTPSFFRVFTLSIKSRIRPYYTSTYICIYIINSIKTTATREKINLVHLQYIFYTYKTFHNSFLLPCIICVCSRLASRLTCLLLSPQFCSKYDHYSFSEFSTQITVFIFQYKASNNHHCNIAALDASYLANQAFHSPPSIFWILFFTLQSPLRSTYPSTLCSML